jgi:hypothetical protein
VPGRALTGAFGAPGGGWTTMGSGGGGGGGAWPGGAPITGGGFPAPPGYGGGGLGGGVPGEESGSLGRSGWRRRGSGCRADIEIPRVGKGAYVPFGSREGSAAFYRDELRGPTYPPADRPGVLTIIGEEPHEYEQSRSEHTSFAVFVERIEAAPNPNPFSTTTTGLGVAIAYPPKCQRTKVCFFNVRVRLQVSAVQSPGWTLGVATNHKEYWDPVARIRRTSRLMAGARRDEGEPSLGQWGLFNDDIVTPSLRPTEKLGHWTYMVDGMGTKDVRAREERTGYEVQCKPRFSVANRGLLIAFVSCSVLCGQTTQVVFASLSRNPFGVGYRDQAAQEVLFGVLGAPPGVRNAQIKLNLLCKKCNLDTPCTPRAIDTPPHSKPETPGTGK